jgi:hypothetical protein
VNDRSAMTSDPLGMLQETPKQITP